MLYLLCLLAQPATDSVEAADAAGGQFNAESRSELAASREALLAVPSLQANLRLRGHLNGRQFEAAGDYVAGSYPQTRLRLEIAIDTLTGTLLQVCDGQVSWTVREVTRQTTGPAAAGRATSPTTQAPTDDVTRTTTIVRRDADRIVQAAGGATPQRRLLGDLGVGGLPALLAGLERCFDFTPAAGSPEVIELHGRWKPEVFAELGLNRDATTLDLPTGVQVTLDRSTTLPLRVLYVRGEAAAAVPMFSLELQDLRTHVELPSTIFEYAPPDDAPFEDLTRQTLAEMGVTP